MLTLDEIKSIEPAVAEILEDAGTHRGAWPYEKYGLLRQRLDNLVGWNSPHKQLRDQHVYEMVITALCKALDI